MNKTIQPEEISRILEKELSTFGNTAHLEEVGTVLQVGDSVARIYGLTNVKMGEIITFPNELQGLVLNLEANSVGAIILGPSQAIKEGDTVKRTGHIGKIKVGEGMIGRVVNSAGIAVDGHGPLNGPLFEMPLERKAPSVIFREPVSEPLETGIKSVDSMIPIGRGQRELIIGDRQTGKTTIAIDTILNQRKFFEQGNPVYCIYVAISQKASTVAQLVSLLEKHGAMDYTTVITEPASAPAPLQFITPFAGVALGEYFRDTGRHALIIYDDLSKHAIAYREISLLLKRPPGREAYPGDIFYLHARLLERAAKISNTDSVAKQMNDLPASLKGKVKGGGSLTALPIIETQAGDVSAYIPTNVISITDGQIFLNNDLFNANLRPAIDVGISVSRVGGSAQTKAMKKVSSTLKLDQAQFRELEAFAKFGSDIDVTTQKVIDRGRKNQKILTQKPFNPMPLGQQVAILYVSTSGYLEQVPIDKVSLFEETYLTLLAKEHPKVLKELSSDSPMDEDTKKILEKLAINLVKEYVEKN